MDTYPTYFVQVKHLPAFGKPIYGIEMYHAVEAITGECDRSECIQKIDGLWRITVKCAESRAVLLTKGINIRGHNVTVLSKNPFLVNGEQGVRLTISNLPYSVSNDTIKRRLTAMGVVTSGKIDWELYHDEKKLTACKTGKRFIYIARPKTALPNTIMVADKFLGYLSYPKSQGEEKEAPARRGLSGRRQQDDNRFPSYKGLNSKDAPLPQRSGLHFGVRDNTITTMAEEEELWNQRNAQKDKVNNGEENDETSLTFLKQPFQSRPKENSHSEELESGELDTNDDDDETGETSLTLLKLPYQNRPKEDTTIAAELESGELDPRKSAGRQSEALFEKDWFDEQTADATPETREEIKLPEEAECRVGDLIDLSENPVEGTAETESTHDNYVITSTPLAADETFFSMPATPADTLSLQRKLNGRQTYLDFDDISSRGRQRTKDASTPKARKGNRSTSKRRNESTESSKSKKVRKSSNNIHPTNTTVTKSATVTTDTVNQEVECQDNNMSADLSRPLVDS